MSPQSRSWRLTVAVVCGCAGAALLDSVLIVARFPSVSAIPTLLLACLMIGGMGVALVRVWQTRGATQTGIALGLVLGLALGSVWALEISFFTFIAPTTFALDVRDLIGDLLDGASALAVLSVGAVCAYRARDFTAGWRTALWTGMISGLVVYLMGALIINVRLDRVVHDVGAIQEYTQRGAASGAPDIYTYWAAQTLSGAVFHLIVLGLLLGAALGAVGAHVGYLLASRGVRRPSNIPEAPSPRREG
jgi:hypothetical protein